MEFQFELSKFIHELPNPLANDLIILPLEISNNFIEYIP